MAEKMDRQEMIKLLHAFDRKLNSKLEIEICGASCAILNHGLERTSVDIDVMRSSIPLTSEELRKAINAVALQNHFENLWINDHSKEVFKHIPEDYIPDTKPIHGERFKHLHPKIISKADFVITKLAYYEHIRQWDIKDLREITISVDDVRSLYRKLDLISGKRHSDALMIEGHFKTIRSDLVKDLNGYSYSNADRIAEYAFKRYGISVPKSELSMWQESLDNVTSKAGVLIAKIDINAAKIIQKGNTTIAAADMNYRKKREKSIDYGPEL